MRLFFYLFIALLLFGGCENKQPVRGVYILISPTKQMLAAKERVLETLEYIINDMSPHDILVIDSVKKKPWKIEFSGTMEATYKQKRALRLAIEDYFNSLKEVTECEMKEDVLSRAKKYLNNETIEKKSLIVSVPVDMLEASKEEIEHMTLSLVGFLGDKRSNTMKLRQKIESQECTFLELLAFKDLDKALLLK